MGSFPTPLERTDRLGALLGVEELWVKRDDLTGFSWGGNKVRAVEHLIGDALERGASTVLVAAGPSSNLAAILAAAAVGAGLKIEQVCYGDEPDVVPSALQSSRSLGAAVTFTGSEDREGMEEVAGRRAEELEADGHDVYQVPRGGATEVGARGFVSAASELQDQLRAVDVVPGTVVLPVGSGGSMTGLVTGRNRLGATWPTVGVSVSRPVDSFEPGVSAVDARSTAPPTARPPDRLVDGRGDGFGRVRPAESDLAAAVTVATGLLIDPVYNAKALFWLADNEIEGPVVYWLTGGALAVMDQLREGCR